MHADRAVNLHTLSVSCQGFMNGILNVRSLVLEGAELSHLGSVVLYCYCIDLTLSSVVAQIILCFIIIR